MLLKVTSTTLESATRYKRSDAAIRAAVLHRGQNIGERRFARAARCADAALPARLWGHAFLATGYIENMILRRGQSEVPAAAMWQKPANVESARVWGCEATIRIRKEGRGRYAYEELGGHGPLPVWS